MEGDFSKRFVFCFFFEVDEFSCYMSKFRIIQLAILGLHGMLGYCHEVNTWFLKKIYELFIPQ